MTKLKEITESNIICIDCNVIQKQEVIQLLHQFKKDISSKSNACRALILECRLSRKVPFLTCLLVLYMLYNVLQGVHSIGLMWWMLAREVLRLRGTISREVPWDVMVDLYFYRDPEEVGYTIYAENEQNTGNSQCNSYMFCK